MTGQNGKLRLLMAEEDERVRAEIKECAYSVEDGELQERVRIVLDNSKERQRRLMDLYWRDNNESST